MYKINVGNVYAAFYDAGIDGDYEIISRTEKTVKIRSVNVHTVNDEPREEEIITRKVYTDFYYDAEVVYPEKNNKSLCIMASKNCCSKEFYFEGV